MDSVFQLECSCNNYPWGKRGNDSLAAKLCAGTQGTGFKVENGKEYSEMWMGDYPVLPAKSLKTGEELHTIINKNKEQLLGKRVVKEFGGVLPYLPKVLHLRYENAFAIRMWTPRSDIRSDPVDTKSITSTDPPE